MKTGMVLGVFLLAAAMPASAQSMNAEQFYQKATTLQGKGFMALFSSGEIKALTKEAQAAGASAAAARKAALNSGQPPRFCPPPGPAKMNNKEFMSRLSALPAADRARIDMAEAMTRILTTKFPCPSSR